MAEPSTSTEMVRVPILGENGRISDDYIPASIPQAVTAAEQAAESAASSANQALQQAAAAEKSASSATGSVEQAKNYANNASKYMTTAESHADSAATDAQDASASASAAAASATAAEESNKSAAQSSADAMGFRNNAVQYRDQAREAAQEAKGYVSTVQQLEQNATNSAAAAQNSATSASASAEIAATAETNASASATNAAASAQTASEKAASVLDHYIESATATTLDAGQQATATVVDKVLQLGIPKGDKGDPGEVSAVTAVEGSDLSVSTDEGTVTIDDSALRERISELEQQAQNVVTGTSTDLVAHGEDAFPQKPIEVRVKGKTWVNRWPVINGTSSGVTVSTDDTGLITVSGTSTGKVGLTNRVYSVAANKSVTVKISSSISGVSINVQTYANGEFIANIVNVGSIYGNRTEATGVISSNATHLVCEIAISADTTVNASFRVMLVDGTEAPDCFTPPASITSVETGNLVTSGKNLLPTAGITDVGANNNATEYVDLLPGTYTISAQGGPFGQIIVRGDDNTDYSAANYNVSNATFTLNQPTRVRFLFWISGEIGIFASNPQLELGSTATPYEPPNVTTTPLPEVELRSLPNGTCDELVIKEDGTCEVERKLGEAVIDAEHPVTVSNVIPASGDNLPYAIVSNMVPPFVSPTAEPYSTEMNSTTWPYAPNLRSRGVYRTSQSVTFVDERFTDVETAQSIINDTGGTFVAQVPSSTEPQSSVTLPTLPAPTFNQYHDADVPSDTSTRYARDINIVLSNLEAVQTALLGGE